LLAGIVIGCTLPQSDPLKLAVDCIVMVIVFAPIAMFIATVVLLVFASTNVVCIVPVILVRPLQLMLADMPVAVSETFVTWHCPCGGLLTGPPYLSIIACVTQTCMVRAGICGMF
jgi:hypothetical protein